MQGGGRRHGCRSHPEPHRRQAEPGDDAHFHPRVGPQHGRAPLVRGWERQDGRHHGLRRRSHGWRFPVQHQVPQGRDVPHVLAAGGQLPGQVRAAGRPEADGDPPEPRRLRHRRLRGCRLREEVRLPLRLRGHHVPGVLGRGPHQPLVRHGGGWRREGRGREVGRLLVEPPVHGQGLPVPDRRRRRSRRGQRVRLPVQVHEQGVQDVHLGAAQVHRGPVVRDEGGQGREHGRVGRV
mmetsp:Transcript_57/g.212  ORF Transcript_57/g.212 Transcript_57/m.212 type:complete len:236 (+) Transcript_57:481-1188(+)